MRKAFVHVKVNDEEVTNYNLLGRTLYLKGAPASGSTITIYRSTSTTRLVEWADASVLRAKDMTIQQVQQLHILEEIQSDLQGWTMQQIKDYIEKKLGEIGEVEIGEAVYIKDWSDNY